MTQENAGADAVLGAAAAMGGAIGAAVGAFQVASAALDKMSAGPATQHFKVNEKNVLKAGALIHDQAKVLETKLGLVQSDLKIPADAGTGGRVGADIAKAWNSRLVGGSDTYAGRVEAYVKSLKALSDQLRDAATQYNISEEDITATFGPKA
ncbi:hypothetical protein AB0A63_22075 [Lentzea sp. NPDC042327]|uniref:hypothetical protein n=1 Tax=Lentzea sp. NPDC042327 TaxID=3154801 RepID=UPI0033F8C022